ncbi:unnamed protein product [Rotaria sp. Silwood2]|nr:unnamed protein product [Rotaria sp. Silwood2]CAF2575632.1 unnamed protein product [Rotaria sp. Silwood2]CAF2823370.1 unnamed protein product [Rotaria sp. Silwood2]CAF2975675.1 unnamed protein product [Rotaria sp. Silwood2]CAF3908429.1 unnamed protein product [Rotaria sp. Silwood2]
MNETSLSIQERFIKFSLLLLFAIPSTICSLYFVYNVTRIPIFRKRFPNQTLIILVCIILLDILLNISITISFYARGYIGIQTEYFCYFWQYTDSTFTGIIIWCRAIFTVERYILVFYPNLLRSQRQKLIYHYIPLILIHTYFISFNIYTVFFYECDLKKKYTEHLCGSQCIDNFGGLSKFNWLFNILFPVFIIVFGSLLIFIRVLWIRREMQRNLRNWSKNWKMIVQLLGMAIIYTIVWIPLSIVSLIATFTVNNSVMETIESHLYFASYLCEMVVPMIALLLAPEIILKLRGHMQSSVMDIASVTMGQHSKH